ncbi:MAG: permease-like cell division protein FtsX [Erysipelotrichaceae bacterium]|jgi:cell division transport system permease protein|nr:permease-like cell division protein FtsX [Erysipelotrichaceae bacterium]
MISRFFRHLRDGASSLKRNSAMSISASSTVAITLFLVAIFIILGVSVQQVTQSVQYRLVIHVKIDNAVTTMTTINDIGKQIEAIDGVRSITFSSKEAELQKFIDENSFYERYKNDNPLNNAYLVTTNSGDILEEVSQQIRLIPGVISTEYGGAGVATLVDALNMIQRVGMVLVLGLSILAVFLISNTIKVTITARRDEIALMRQVGATNGFIRAPFLVEGVLIGALGAIIPILVSVFGYYYIYTESGGHLFAKMFELEPVMPFVLILAGILLGFGMIVGLTGSFISTTKYLRWKR